MSLNTEKEDKTSDIPDIENHHYYIFSSEFDSSSSSDAIKFIIARNLMKKDRPKQIKMIINSPGGNVPSAFALIDTMKGSKIPVYTYGLGEIASCGLLTFMAGAKGKRFVLPEARTMIHRVSSGTPGTRGSVHVQELQFEDAKRSFEESQRINKRLTELYVKHNTAGKTYDELFGDMKFDTFLSAAEAVEYGLADRIVTKRE